MTHDLKNQLDGTLQPLRDWFPLSSYSAFTSVMDMLQGAGCSVGLVVVQLSSELRNFHLDCRQ
jgi:hypothetical protein